MEIKIFGSINSLFFISLLILTNKTAMSQTEYYIPKALIIPIHTHKQELHVSLGKGGGYDANISYALTKHLAVFTTGTFSRGTSKRIGFFGDRFNIYKNDYAVKGGIGYFSTLNHKFVNHIESYTGFGSYKVDNFWFFPAEKETSGYETKAKFWNAFWQFQATHKINKHELTVAIRFAYSKYNELNYRNRNPTYNLPKTRLEGLWGVTIDPVISYSYLLNKLKFNVQAGMSGFSNSVTISQSNGITKLGLSAPIGRLSVQYNFDFRPK